MSLTSDSVSKYLKDEVGLDIRAITPDTALFTSNLLDSFSLVDLILFVESETGAPIDPDDVRIENFDSVSRIIRFAESRQGSAPT
ncbi:MAG: acyl carrier protein [Woeseia sp.]